jgi:hypothetical protein
MTRKLRSALYALPVLVLGILAYHWIDVRYGTWDLSDAWGGAVVTHLTLSHVGEEILHYREVNGKWPEPGADLLSTASLPDLLEVHLDHCSDLQFVRASEDLLIVSGALQSEYDEAKGAPNPRIERFELRCTWSDKVAGKRSSSGTPGLEIVMKGPKPSNPTPGNRT